MARDRFNESLSKWRIYLRTMTKRMKKRIVCRVNIWVRIYQHIAVFTFNQVYETGSQGQSNISCIKQYFLTRKFSLHVVCEPGVDGAEKIAFWKDGKER